MTKTNNREPISSSELASLFAEIAWPIGLLSRAGAILVLSQPLLDLLDAPAQAFLGQPFETLVLEKERKKLRSLFETLARGGVDPTMRVHLSQPAHAPIAAEIKIALVASGGAEYVTIVVYPVSIIHRRQRILLEFNLLAPSLLESQSASELYDKAARALQPLGMAMLVAAFEPDQAALRIEYFRPKPALSALLGRYKQLDLTNIRIPPDAPGFERVLNRRETVFAANLEPLFQAVFPEPEHTNAIYQSILGLFGRPRCILAPLLAGTRVHGVLVIWSQALDREQTPFIEAFAHQLAAVLSQIELQTQMRRQVQRLDSLTATVQAVTSLQSLDDVLRVVCKQAQLLLGAQFARIVAPATEISIIKYIMSTGELSDHLLDIPIPVDASISGAVFRSGQGRMIADLQQEPGVYAPFKARSTARSVLYQPLEHQGAVLGVLIVGHTAIGYFSQEDLDYVGRYAEYAAVAIANAQLHAALQQSETEQQRQRRELQALLDVSQAINVSLDLDTLLQDGLRVIDELGMASMSAVILLAPDCAGLVLRAQRGAPAVCMPALLEAPAVVEHIHTGRPLRLADQQIEPIAPIGAGIHTGLPLHIIFIPLLANGQPLGSLCLGQAGALGYSERDTELLQAIANQVAQAIAKATVHERLRTTASENEKLYREAEEVRSYLNTLVQNTPDLLITIRNDMTMRVLNPERLATSVVFGAQPIEGQTFLSLAPAHMHEHLLHLWRDVLSGRSQNFELELRLPAGGSLCVLISAALIADYGEIFVMIKDVTEQRQHEAYLRQNEKLAALGGMVAGAAHELNNPLAAILGLAELQLDQDLSADLRSDLKQIERSALRARSIVQQLLNFARPQPPHTQPVALPALINETLDRLAQTMRAAGIQTVVDIPLDLPDTAGDSHQLEQVLFNILHNAALSLDSNLPEQPRKLHISASQEDHLIQLSIQDTGPGISQDQLSRIFDPFFTTRVVGQGTGLGLAISHTIIRQHDGRIWATSQPGKGATFFIQLPISGQAEPQASPLSAALPDASARILLVEDEDLVRQVVARTLTRQGYRVEAVASGLEAIERVLAHEYELIISDLHMPGIDGPTLYSRLHRQRPNIRWMIITGDTMNERSHAFLEHTKLAALRKPFTGAQLLTRVAECLSE